MIRILAISGSLRCFSSNTTLLQAAARLAPQGVEITLYNGLAELPHFNPDLEGSEPATVVNFRARIKGSDGVLISSPEYAHGVPGALKNALDWIVGSGELVDKPVALLNASPRATLAQASLTETIRVMSAHVVEEASLRIPLMGRNLDASGAAGDPELARLLATAIAEFTSAIENSLSNAKGLVESAV